ncbi:hypothetical protein [Breznakiella homolactica]|uniref:DUF5640 domain-containing protein n=1 Tax=Breznakiella homolactica TaxID=2798577 RepID=A0A7T8BB32_9SPIR|nr:hypothetical protein [Breznakiella homolactica]QQO08808.1 hypothetical protein JFL75_18045 [Breznakiella homolactica]
MKKRITAGLVLGLLILAALPAQTGQDSSLEGIWTGKDEIGAFHFIFQGNTLFMLSRNTVSVGTFSAGGGKLRYTVQKQYDGYQWNTGKNDILDLEYLFSGGRLILVFGGDPLSLEKVN